MFSGANPGFSFRGRKRLCALTQIASAKPNSLSAGVQGPLKGPGSSKPGGGGTSIIEGGIGTCRWTGYDFHGHQYWHRVSKSAKLATGGLLLSQGCFPAHTVYDRPTISAPETAGLPL